MNRNLTKAKAKLPKFKIKIKKAQMFMLLKVTNRMIRFHQVEMEKKVMKLMVDWTTISWSSNLHLKNSNS